VTRVLSGLSAIVLVAGIVVVFTGALPLAILLILLGLAGLALAFVVNEAKRLYVSAREWVRLFAEGRPRSLRLVSVEAPKGFILDPDAKVTLEAESRSGVVKQHTQGVPVPRLYAFFWKLATWVRIPLPKRLDFERMVRLQLRRAEEQAEAKPPAASQRV
jgi:uncharacterized protein (DUF58 family)